MYRGRRGGHNRGRYSSSDNARGHRGGRGGHPAGLKGRDIGLYYARKSRSNAQKHRPIVSLTEAQRRNIYGLFERMCDLHPRGHSFRPQGSHQSHFMRAYHQNLARNECKNDLVEQEVDNWESLDVEEEENDLQFNIQLKEAFETRRQDGRYLKMLEFRKKLPAFQMKEDIVKLMEDNRVVVISGETGCGKTTQVPQFILDHAVDQLRAANTHIVCTQPRRISAITVADRVAEERGEQLGNSVGYQIRLESRLPKDKRGSIMYCTTGVVLQWMRSNPQLKGISHIVLDEIHERDILTDFLMTLLKDLLYGNRPDLKVILMSATLNADRFSRYFNGCPKMNIPGFTFDVKEFYLEDVLEMTGFEIIHSASNSGTRNVWQKHTSRSRDEERKQNDYRDFIGPFLRHIRPDYSDRTLSSLESPKSEEVNLDLIAALIHHIHVHKGDGAILVFLTGWDEISKLNSKLCELKHLRDLKIYPLHSLMPTTNQREIFKRPPKGHRKVVLATNIAETSITIDDIVYVVDCGKIKMSNFDVEANIATLKPEWVSLANARQRRGRAGRVQPGICYHLYTRAREMVLDQFVKPEMLRTRLEEVILQIKLLELGKSWTFLGKVMDRPDEKAVQLSTEMLENINALDSNENLTPLGFHLAQLPMDPQTGKMILLAAIFSCLDPILSVAASLSFKDAFVIPLGKEEVADKRRCYLAANSKSDHIMLAKAMKGWEESQNKRDYCWQNFLSESTLKMLDNMKRQFAGHLVEKNFLKSADVKDKSANRNSDNEALVRAVICAGLYPNVASLKMKKFPVLQTAQERRVNIHPKSVNAKETEFKYPWMVYHLKMKSSSTFIYDCSMVSPLALVFFGQYVKQGRDTCEDGTVLDTISVDRFVKFNCAVSTCSLVKDLREALDCLLEYKIEHPGSTNWDSATKEGALLKAITGLLTSELEGTFVEEEEDD